LPDARWVAVLDELERRVASGDSTSWTPPADLGPLPGDLAPRARDLMSAQQEAIARAEAELRRIGDELSTLRRTPAAPAARASAYIDTVA
jgi:hypothetical protein